MIKYKTIDVCWRSYISSAKYTAVNERRHQIGDADLNAISYALNLTKVESPSCLALHL